VSRILISACLLGQAVRYDGRGKALDDPRLARWQAEGRLVPLCPEVATGLPVPRAPAEIEVGGTGAAVLDGVAGIRAADGADLTAAFEAGAELALELARREGCRFALLTDGSPSCGSTRIHAGGFDGTRVPGAGVVAALLSRAGIEVFAPDRIDALEAALMAADDLRASPETVRLGST
jgi:uncharacterized protein YbbK (DUF523 family)